MQLDNFGFIDISVDQGHFEHDAFDRDEKHIKSLCNCLSPTVAAQRLKEVQD